VRRIIKAAISANSQCEPSLDGDGAAAAAVGVAAGGGAFVVACNAALRG